MARIPAITAPSEIPFGPVPGPSRGLVAAVEAHTGAYAGPELSKDTFQEFDITSEQVASGPRNVVFPWFLPYHESDVMRESEIMRRVYRQMLADPRVKTAVLGKLFGVGLLDVRMIPADKKNRRDQQIAEHMQWMLTRRLHGGVPNLVWTVLVHALIDGYSVSEKITKMEERGKYAGNYHLVDLKSKDAQWDIVPQTDEYWNIVGFFGTKYNAGIEFDPARFVYFRHLPLFNSPTGMSDLRAAYQSYWMLDTVYKLRAMASEKYAIPFLIGTYLNTTVKTSLEAALKRAKSQRWLSFPEGSKVEAINMAGAAEDVFKSFVADLRHDIFLSVQGAVLQTLEGETTDARGNSQVHQSTSDKFVKFLAQSLEACLNDCESGLIKDYVDLNYVVSEYPQAVLDSVDVNELQSHVQVDLALHQLGLPLSKNELYERYERRPPEDNEDVLAAAPPPSSPPSSTGGPSPALGESLPFGDSVLPPPEGEAHPFRRFSEPWRHYLAAAS